MRIVLSVLMLLALTGAARSGEWAGPTNCGAAKFDPQITLCGDADLRKTEVEIGALYYQLRDRFTGHDRKVFVAEQFYWARMRSGCMQLGADHTFNRELLFPCLKEATEKRLTFLRAMLADSSLLLSSTGGFKAVDPWYLNEFGQQYAGEQINLFGWIEGIACDRPPGPARARIANEGVATPVAFSELGPVNIEFLCEKKPGGYWHGVVKLDAEGQPYLYATMIFSRPIPE